MWVGGCRIRGWAITEVVGGSSSPRARLPHTAGGDVGAMRYQFGKERVPELNVLWVLDASRTQ